MRQPLLFLREYYMSYYGRKTTKEWVDMLSEIFKMVMTKSIAKDFIGMATKSSNRGEDVVKEKLGVSSIDEFMKMDIREYGVKKKN